MRFLSLSLLLFLAACNRWQVTESNETALSEQAGKLEKAADASVDESIAEMTREGLAETAGNEGSAQ